MRKASKSSSKNLQVNIIKDTNLPPDLIRVNQKMVYKQSFKDKFGIIVESIGTANFQLIQDIPRVDNLYIEISDIYYKFDINKIDELFLVEESVSRNSFTGVILLVEREYYEFPYGNIKVRVGGSTEASSSSSSSSLSSSSSSSRIPESRNQNDIPDLQNKMIEGFLRNNGKQIGEYTVNGSTSGKINVIEPRLFNLTASFLKQPDITDPDLEFYVLNPSINKHISSNHNQVYTIYKLNVRNIKQKQYITNTADAIAGVLFTYKDDEQLAVRMDQLYYEKLSVAKVAPIGLPIPPEKTTTSSLSTTTSSMPSEPLETIDYNLIPDDSQFRNFLNNNLDNKSVANFSRNFKNGGDIQDYLDDNHIDQEYNNNFGDKLKMDEFFFFILIKNDDDTFTIYKINEANIDKKKIVIEQDHGTSNTKGILFLYNRGIPLFDSNRSIYVPFKHLFSQRKVEEDQIQIAIVNAKQNIQSVWRTNGARYLPKDEEFKIDHLKPLNPDGFFFDDTCFQLFLCLPGPEYYVFTNVQSVDINGENVTINYIDINDKNRPFRMQTNINLVYIWDACGDADEMEEPDIGNNEDYEVFDYDDFIRNAGSSEGDDDFIYEDDKGFKVPARIIKSTPSKSGPMVSFKSPTTGIVTTVPLASIKPGSIKVKKQPKKTLIVFTPLDYKHYQSYNSMYSVYFVINSNILFEIPIFDPKSNLESYPIEHNQVLFIPTDKFFGYLYDYDFDTRTDGIGYYHKDYNIFKTNDDDKKDAEDNYNLIKGQLDSITAKIENTYAEYNKKKADLQSVSIVKKTAEDAINEAKKRGVVPPLALNQNLDAATKSFNDRNALFVAIQTTINTDNAEKQRLEIALVAAGNVVDNIKTRIKQTQYKTITVSKQFIFLVNKKYLKTQANTEYILIDYKSKYKINPFIDKNITNFNYNIYDIYIKYPDSCKIFFHEYDGVNASGSIGLERVFGKKIEPVIKIEKIEFVPETQNTVDVAAIIGKLKSQIQPSIKDYQIAEDKYDRFVRAGADLRDASSSFSKAVYKTASIYTKLVDFDNSDFKQTMSYLDDEDKLYEKIYTFFKPNDWDTFVRNIIARENLIKTRANITIIQVNGSVNTYIDNQATDQAIVPTKPFYETVIKQANFVKSKYHRFLKEAVELKEKSIQLQNKSAYYATEAINDPGNQILYNQLSQNNMDESTKLLTESNELIYKLNRGKDELNTIYIVCKILVVTLPHSILAGVIVADDESLMIKCNMLNILGNIIETQGLIAEKIEENNQDALQYYQRAQIEYTSAINEIYNVYISKNKLLNGKVLVYWMSFYNDDLRNIVNMSRVFKSIGDIVKSDEQIVLVQPGYTFVFKKLNEYFKLLASGDIYKILYDYAMFLITTKQYDEAFKYLKKANGDVTAKIKDLGPYNLYVMNIKRELDYLDKTLEIENYFYLFDSKPSSYTIEYTDDSNKNISKKIDSKFLFLQYSSNQSDYATDLFIPISLRKINTGLEKQLDDDLYKTYEADKQSYIIIYTDKTNPYDNFILTKIEPVVNKTSPPQLTSGVMKTVIGGAGKSYETEYFTEFGDVRTQNIDDDSLFIIKTPQVNTVNSGLLNSFWNKTTTFVGNVKSKLGFKPGIVKPKTAQQPGTAKGLSSAVATIVNQTNIVKPPEIVPNELFIVLNTSIPGSQKIYYSPKMTIKDSNAKSIRFDPLIELDQSVINKVPKDLRIKQFFDKGLFESLINLHGMEKVRTLIEAMNDGIINNNILVTLNTIFAINTPIYINGDVYYIADVQWTQGDWAIDTKEKPVSFDVSKIKNPYIYSAVVNDDIISGQSQLKALSTNVLTGSNYKGLPPQMNATPSSLSTISPLSTLIGVPVAQGLPLQQGPQLIPVPAAASAYVAPPPPPPPPAQNLNVQVTSPALEAAAQALAAQAAAQAKAQTLAAQTLAAQPLAITAGPPLAITAATPAATTSLVPVVANKYPALPPSSPAKGFPALTAPVGVIVKNGPSFNIPKPVLNYNEARLTGLFRTFFNAPAYFSTLNSLVTSITEPDNKILIKEIESAITTTDVKILDPKTRLVKPGLSQTAYEQTVGGLSISSTNSDGNCFFEAIANAINQYNYTNQQIGKNNAVDRIRYRAKDGSVYGESNNIFTIEKLRRIVYDFLSNTTTNNATYLDQKYTQAVNQAEDLNNIYKDTFETHCRDKGIKSLKRNNPQVIQEYFDYTGQLFHNTDDRIFMKNPRLSDPDFDDPFKTIDLNTEFETYITSTTAPVETAPDIKGYYPEYWGDAVAIDILNSVLKLKIIVLKNGSEDGTLRPDIFDNGLFENQTPKEIADLGCNLNEWNKYLFVYNPGGHYVLLTFTYSTKEDSKASKSKIIDTNTYTIFKKEDYILPPPLYIYFLIFYTKFLLLPQDKKLDFNFFRDFFLIMDDSYQRILGTNSEAGYRVIENFNTWNPQRYFRESLRTYTWQPPEPSKRGRPVGAKTLSTGDPTRSSTRLNPSDTTMVPYSKGGASNTRTRKNYNNNYNNNYRNNYPNNFLKRDAVRDVSKIGYYISMDLELKKGSPLTPEEISESKCTRKWNTVRKAFANFTGKTYAIPPVYDYSNKQTLKNKPNNKPNNVTKSNKPPLQIQTQAQATPQTNVANPTNKTGGTRKNEVKKIYLTGKHNKTVKKL